MTEIVCLCDGCMLRRYRCSCFSCSVPKLTAEDLKCTAVSLKKEER